MSLHITDPKIPSGSSYTLWNIARFKLTKLEKSVALLHRNGKWTEKDNNQRNHTFHNRLE